MSNEANNTPERQVCTMTASQARKVSEALNHTRDFLKSEKVAASLEYGATDHILDQILDLLAEVAAVDYIAKYLGDAADQLDSVVAEVV